MLSNYSRVSPDPGPQKENLTLENVIESGDFPITVIFLSLGRARISKEVEAALRHSCFANLSRNQGL
jgi:hypothetical protein